MGMPDENKIGLHPLGSKGLQEYEFQKVAASTWIAEIEDRYNTISEFSHDGRVYEHYIFTFHDRSFECIASGYKIKYSKKDKMMESIVDSVTEI